jgi:hypothetical protein
MKPLAIRATYSDLKLVKTRQVAQLIFEIPISEFDAAYEVLGGLPTPDGEKWFAIAALKDLAVAEARPEPKDKPVRAKRDWRDMLPAQQAGIRCDEPSFLVFLCEERTDDMRESNDAAECVRLICGVESRADLSTNHKARVIWHQLDEQYQAWKAVEHA